MELCTEGHVFDILRKRRRVPEPQVRSIVRDICIGLEYVHSERIIHRDIKP
jgi:serine/threonine protein kinase